MTASVYDVLDQLRNFSTSESDKGTKFEQLMVAFLTTDPTYAEQFTDVWLWKDWPGRAGKPDTGIDLVAVDRLTGDNVAIQCKFYAEGHHVSKKDIDTFLSASGTNEFKQRIIVSTGADWGPHAEAALQNQQVPVRRIGMSDLENSTIDWSVFTWAAPQVVQTTGKKSVRQHQRVAIDKVTAGLGESDRGKLIMACGTGKTFTSLRLAEENVGVGGTVLFLVPSISLLSQTVREWATEAQVPLRMLAVCSDAKSTKRSTANEDISAVDVALPATTNLAVLQERWTAATQDESAMTVVFSTYQSIEVVANAQTAGGFAPFDLIICDEAHRTTGVTLAGADESAFVRVHDDDFIQGTKRLYMTATPRIFGEESKKKATTKDAVIASMDDEETYGPELHRLGFGEAVEKNLLTDYRVLILTVDEKYVSGNFQTELAEDGEIQLSDAAKIIGCWNGLAKHFDAMPGEPLTPMRRAVAFAPNIATSKAIAAAFPTIVDRHVQRLETTEPAEASTEPATSRAGSDHPDHADDGGVVAGVGVRSQDLQVQCDHVDGTFNALERNQRLDWLKADVPEGTCRVLTNARCLSEGVDVPALDAVMFLTPRGSEVDVVQSVGRVMRRAEGKEYGYIILPVAVPSGSSPDEALADNKRYAVVWQVLNALRSHDDRFDATVNKIDLNKKKTTARIGFGGINADGELSTGPDYVQGGLDLTWGEGWRDAIYAKIVDKVGNRKYWASWAGDVAQIAQQVTERIHGILTDQNSPAATEFDRFLDGLRGNLNENITAADAIEMLAQHLITRPIFQALFGEYDFTASNPVAQIMEGMLTALDEHNLDTETASLDKFYDSVALRLDDIDNTAGRQRILVDLYDNFFAKAFKRRVEKNGIVYTPIEIVDFILRSADELSREHFGQGLTDEGVHILDGFTGTGTFIVRLLQLGLIEPKDLVRKYRYEIHANELLLLAYYIAAVNIESAFLDARRDALERRPVYEPFPGLVLTDTFQSYEPGDRLDDTVFAGNNERLTRQKANPITVVIGNPPYSVGQDSANDNNANDTYPGLDTSIRDSYAAKSTATNKNSLYDSYIRAFRWATLRLQDRGIIAFVTNGGWIDANTADGMRKTLVEEFSDIHIYNLRGNARTSGEQRQKEAGSVFGAGSRATVAITLLVRDPSHTCPVRIHYTDIGDYLTREQKLEAVAHAASVNGLPAVVDVSPNEHGDWLNQRRDDFEAFMPIEAIFQDYGRGLETARDAWVYNFSEASLRSNVQRHIAAYDRVRQGLATAAERDDPTRLSWSRSLRAHAAKGTDVEFRPGAITQASYRPFARQHVYLDRFLNNVQGIAPRTFPTPRHPNVGFYQVGAGSAVPFSVLMLSWMPDLHVTGAGSGGQFFARWRYEKAATDDGTLSFGDQGDSGEVVGVYRKIDNIADEALATFVAAYGDSFTKDDVFYYAYGLLHSPDYRATYAADLKRMLPRIPLVVDPAAYLEAGKRLMQLHLGYECVDPYPLEGLHQVNVPTGDDAYGFYAVTKMAFTKTRDLETKKLVADKTSIVYNQRITLTGIPEEAHRYMLGSRSAIEWIIDRYQVKTDKASGIVNDPNDWSREVGDPRYILDLLARVVTVSLETMQIVDSLPPLTVLEQQ